MIQEISILLENTPSTLAKVLATLMAHNINIRAMSIGETADFGVLRFIVNHPGEVVKSLQDANIAAKITPVLSLVLDDNPGRLLEKIQKISDEGINIEYFYAFAAVGVEKARVVLKVNNLEKAQELIEMHEVVLANDEVDFYW
jgi:hypothetical protein